MKSNGNSEPRAHGHCLCGAVEFEVHGPLRPVVACHCQMCRRTSGHFVAATACKLEHLRLIRDRGLRWFESSDTARRGFCQICGANVFWQPNHAEHISIMAGTLDSPTGLSIAVHIFAGEAGDYYRLCDNVPTRVDGAHGLSVPAD